MSTELTGGKTVSLFMPTLNELECLKVILPRIKREWFDEIIVVDGGSTDGTVEFLQEQGIKVMPEEIKGAVHAYNQAFHNTTSDIFMTFTPDGNCIPELIPEALRQMRDDYDVVYVSRFLPPAKSYDDTLITGFGNWMFRVMINILFRANCTDPLGSFRAYRREAVLRMGLDTQPQENALRRRFHLLNTWEVGSPIRATKLGLRTKEIPGDEPARIAGTSAVHIFRNGTLVLTQILDELFRGRRVFNRPTARD